jgi:hypothetical protein
MTSLVNRYGYRGTINKRKKRRRINCMNKNECGSNNVSNRKRAVFYQLSHLKR